MHATLLVPGLFWPRETTETVASGLELPALTHLLSRARKAPVADESVDAWLCRSHGIARQHDWPLAPLTYAFDGGAPGEAYWLRADPVHIRVERNGLTFVGTALLELTAEESTALVGSLNAHFEPVGISFHAPARERWYVRLATTPDLVTRSPDEVVGADVRSSLPRGGDALSWHGVFNEAQMLLHAHAVNALREESGAPAVNSVWFWGGGTRPHVHTRAFEHACSDHAEASAVAAASGADVAPLPASAAAWLASPGGTDSRHLVVLDALALPFAFRDVETWRTRLAQLEAVWFGPILAALRAGTVKRLTLVVPGAGGGACFEATRADLLKFWRARKSLAQLG